MLKLWRPKLDTNRDMPCRTNPLPTMYERKNARARISAKGDVLMRNNSAPLNIMLVTAFILAPICFVQAWVNWRVDSAELYALRAARDYEFAVLIQKTKELNQAALAVLRNEFDTTCVQGEAGSYTAFRFGTQLDIDSSDFRPSAPLPAIHRITDKPERASPQVD